MTSGESTSSPGFGNTAFGGKLKRKSRTISTCCSVLTCGNPGTFVHAAGGERNGSLSEGHRGLSFSRSVVAQNAVILVYGIQFEGRSSHALTHSGRRR